MNTRIPVQIIEKVVLFTGQKIEPEKTLLFIDEIQECPDAIVSMRYFHEEMPELHVIGAGSLLGFDLLSEEFRMPVGRVQYLYLYPMSFGEFLEALEETELRNFICNYDNLKKLPVGLHEKLNDYIRKYYIIGGMPAVINEYVSSRDITKCQRIQIMVEIKSGSTGHMKSIWMFIKKYHSKQALKISQAPFAVGIPITSLPFYAIESFIKKV